MITLLDYEGHIFADCICIHILAAVSDKPASAERSVCPCRISVCMAHEAFRLSSGPLFSADAEMALSIFEWAGVLFFMNVDTLVIYWET